MSLSRPIQPNDTGTPTQLYTYLVERERESAALHNRIVSLESQKGILNLDKHTATRIAGALSASGMSPVSLDGLPGITRNAQNPNIPTLSSLPNPSSTLYTMVVVKGVGSNTMYRLDNSKIPYSWQKIGDLAGLASTGPGVVRQVALGASLTVGPVDDTTLSPNVALLNRDAQVFTGSYNQFNQVGIGGTPSDPLHLFGALRFGAGTFTANQNRAYTTAVDGLIVTGNGSVTDFILVSKSGLNVFDVPTGTTTAHFYGNVGIGTATIPSMLTVAGLINLKNYTVATLPAGTRGDICYCTDLLAPGFLVAAVGGGAVVGPVFRNATTWVAV